MPSSSSETVKDICDQLGYSYAKQGSEWTVLSRLTSKFMRTHGNELPTLVSDSNEAKELAFKFCYEKYSTDKNGDTTTHGEHFWPASSDKIWYRDEEEILVLVARLICTQERHKCSNKKQKNKQREETLKSLTLRDDSPMPVDSEPQATVEAENSSNTLPVINNSVHSDLDEAINAVIQHEEQDDIVRERSRLEEVESSESFKRQQQRQRRISDPSWSPSPSKSTHTGQKRKRQQNSDHLLKDVSTEEMRIPGSSRLDPQVRNTLLGLASKRRTRQTTVTEFETHEKSLKSPRLSPREVSSPTSMFADHVDISSKDTNTENGIRTPPTTAKRMVPPRFNPDVENQDEQESITTELQSQLISANIPLSYNEPLRPPASLKASKRIALSPSPLFSFAVPPSPIDFCVLKYHSGFPGLSQPIPIHKLAAKGLDFQNCGLSELFKWYNSFSGMPEALESLKCLVFMFYEGSLRRHWEIEASDPDSSFEALKTRIRESVCNSTQYGHSASFMVEVTPPGWEVIGFDRKTSLTTGLDRSPVTPFPN